MFLVSPIRSRARRVKIPETGFKGVSSFLIHKDKEKSILVQDTFLRLQSWRFFRCMSTSSRMSPSNPVVTEAGEPSTYQHVEKALSNAVGSGGEDAQETDPHGTDLRLTCEGHLPHDDWESNPRQKSAVSDPPPKDHRKEVLVTSKNALQESTPKKPISLKCEVSRLQPVPSQNQCSTSQVEVETKAPSSEYTSRIAESVEEHTPAEPNAEPRQHVEDFSSPPIAIVTFDQSSKERHSSTRNQTNSASIKMVLSEQQGNSDDSTVSISI